MTDTLFPMAELAQRWAVTPNTVSRRLAFLGIKPIRQGNYRFLTSDQYELATALHDHVQKGQPMETFPRPQEGEGEATTLVRRTVRSDHADPTMALVAAMAAKLTPPPDPLQQARRLKEAAELAVWLSNAEMAAVLGVSTTTLEDKSHDYSPRPGITLERHQEGKGKPIWWRVRQEGAKVSALPTSGATSRQVGFGAAVEAKCQVLSALVELPRLLPG